MDGFERNLGNYGVRIDRILEEGDGEIDEVVEIPCVVASQGLYSLRFETQRKSRIWGTENEFKVSMAC